MLIQILLGAVGVTILVFVLLDFLYTAIGAAPVAPLSQTVARGIWRVFVRVMPDSRAKHRLAGPVVMTGIAFTTTVSQGRGLLTKAPMFDADSDEMNNVMLPALADLVANLNAMQFALYYSAEDPSRRLPAGLVELARRVAPYPEKIRRLRIALAPLPGFKAPEGRTLDQLSDQEFIARLDAWAQRYTV